MDNGTVIDIAKNSREVLSPEMAWLYRIIPHRTTESEYQFYTDVNSCTDNRRNELEIFFGKKITLIPIHSEEISKSLSQHYIQESRGEDVNKGARLLETSQKDFVSQLFMEAKSLNSSDIHIETYQLNCRVRLRIDGKLVERMRGDGFNKVLKELQQRANIIKSVSLHSLRHSIATHLLEQGVSIEQVRDFLGHQHLESTQIYTHISKTQLEAL